MNLFRYFRDAVVAALTELVGAGKLPAGLDFAKVAVEPTREAGHGDIATNAAMVLARAACMKPRDLAEPLAERLRRHPAVTAVDIAGPGFINLSLGDDFWRARIADILAAGRDYGRSDMGRGHRVNVEYVSANPNGPLHIGHARGAVFGDALAALLEYTGYSVTREYYVNDAGNQLEVLARSIYHRYCEALGDEIGSIAPGLYPGEYVKDIGQALANRDGPKLMDAPRHVWMEACANFGCETMLAVIKDDLKSLGVIFADDQFRPERALHKAGRIDEAVEALNQAGLIYSGVLEPPKGKIPEDWEPREQLLFRATRFGDDVDRPLKKSNDNWTYFAADIAYHFDKIRRGFQSLIDVWGADHAGYVKRMKAAVAALSNGKVDLDIKICQLVRLSRGGQEVKMSKRAGTFVTLSEVVDEVGKDVVRFIMLTRKNDAPLDFDLAKVIEQSRDNPVYYVQYAHARARSVLRHAAAELAGLDLSPAALAAARLERLGDEAEIALIKFLAGWPRAVEAAAEAHEPHRIAFYLYDAAAAFHALWNKGKDNSALRFLIADDRYLTLARLALVQATATVIAAGLGIMGVTPVEEMR